MQRESAKGWSLVTSMFFPFLNGSLKMARGLDANKKKREGELVQRGNSKAVISEARMSRWKMESERESMNDTFILRTKG